MRIGGIIAEYNPFHNGHRWLIDQMRSDNGGKATHIVAVMSGNFVQRGEPALLPKEERVKMALENGVDLVVELPLPYVLSSAEGFADGAVALLHHMGCVDMLGFGSECGDATQLEETAALLDDERFLKRMRFFLDGGISYAEARQSALREMAGARANLLDGANNTLALEYIRALRRRDDHMERFTVTRRGAAHDAALPSGTTASATYIREMITDGRVRSVAPYMPPAAYRVLTQAMADGKCPTAVSRAERALLYALRRMTPAEMATLPQVSEGLDNRLYKATRTADSFEALVEAVRTRRYPAARVRRLLWAAYTGLTADDRLEIPPYIRVLGLSKRGEEILAAIKEARIIHQNNVSLLTRAPQIEQLSAAAKRMFQLECTADDLYDLMLPIIRPCGSDYTMGMIRAESE